MKAKKEIDGGADKEEMFMRQALAEARKAESDGEVPVGAVVVRGGRVSSRGRNSSIHKNDQTAHAEIVALRRASMKANNYRLEGSDLYVTLEPCAMCLGAAVHARIRRLVYGATDPKAGAVRSAMRFPLGKMNHRLLLREGVLAAECGGILREFFRKKRAGDKPKTPG